MDGNGDKTLTDLGRRELNLRHYKVEETLPDHIIQNYPKFVQLLKTYYQFEDEEESPTNLLNELFYTRDITQTDLKLLSFVEDELLLGQSYFEGFTNKREAAKYSNTLYRSKGTKYSIQQFFRTFFNIDPDIVYPKRQIFTLNESEIGASSQRYLTDDKLYQTYSILIKSELAISEWREMYKLFVHPAGMFLGSEVQIVGQFDLDITDQRDPGVLDLPPFEVEGIATMREPLAIAQHTALFDLPGSDEQKEDHEGLKFRMSMGSPNTYPNPGGNDLKDVEEISIEEIHKLQSSLVEFLEPNSPTFDEDHDGEGSGHGLSSLETLDQDQFTWKNVIRQDNDNPINLVMGDSDGEITLDEFV
jgi:hypothetical protein